MWYQATLPRQKQLFTLPLNAFDQQRYDQQRYGREFSSAAGKLRLAISYRRIVVDEPPHIPNPHFTFFSAFVAFYAQKGAPPSQIDASEAWQLSHAYVGPSCSRVENPWRAYRNPTHLPLQQPTLPPLLSPRKRYAHRCCETSGALSSHPAHRGSCVAFSIRLARQCIHIVSGNLRVQQRASLHKPVSSRVEAKQNNSASSNA